VAISRAAKRSFIPYGQHYLDENDVEAVVRQIRKGPLTQGPTIGEFEKQVAHYVGSKYAVAVSSGTAALHLACLAAGIKPNDNGITTPITFIASANAIVYCGGTPHFVDIDPETLNISPDLIAAKCRELGRVKVIIPVHFGGFPCDMEAIGKIGKNAGAIVIEDAAHALGAVYPDGGRVGNCKFSTMTVFSFHPVKLIAAGEGGMITTNDQEIYGRLLQLRSHGIERDPSRFRNQTSGFTDGEPNPWYYEMQELGFNYRLTDIQAALGISQMSKIETFLKRRKEIAAVYDRNLGNFENVSIVQSEGRERSAHHLYVLRINFGLLGLDRLRVMQSLRKKRVGTQVHYIPVHHQPFYQRFGFKPGSLPQADYYYDQALSLPMYYGLSASDQRYVIESVKAVVSK